MIKQQSQVINVHAEVSTPPSGRRPNLLLLRVRERVLMGLAVLALGAGGFAVSPALASQSHKIYSSWHHKPAHRRKAHRRRRPASRSRGPKGSRGPRGAAGLGGSTGPIGATGQTGSQGATGAQGLVGVTGATGAAGPTGAAGSTGAQGLAGPQGLQGVTGTVGATGAAGARGLQGLVGEIGPEGPTGPAGPAGPAGPIGATGPIGAQGAAGATGAAGLQGPTGATGAIGPAGPAGATGAVGPAGPIGATGPAGSAGVASLIGGSQGLLSLVPGIPQFLAPSSQSVPTLVALGNLAVIPAAETASNLHVSTDGSVLSLGGTVKLTLMVNGVASTLSCTVPSGASMCADSTHTVALAAGNEVAFEVLNAGLAVAVPVSFGWQAN